MKSSAFSFGTKAETLASLSGRLRSAVIMPLTYTTVDEWRHSREEVLDRIMAQSWAHDALVVRSSSLSEDTDGSSNAGRFHSELGVRGRSALGGAVDAVIRSYLHLSSADQVLVQPQLTDVVASGVASSCDPSTGGPYRVINWSESRDTAAVTAGREDIHTWYRLAHESATPPSPHLRHVPALIDELELLAGAPFELEFGVTSSGTLVLFQARPLAARRCDISMREHQAAVRSCQEQLDSFAGARPPTLGDEAVFGVMPDWNPAEMIGLRPRPLARSLYEALITDWVWAESRALYGYRDVRGTPLMIQLAGLPYIDVRASFTSLVPGSLDADAAENLVSHYVRTLRTHPHLHDKVEFSILHPSYHFTIRARVAELVKEGVLSSAQAVQLLDGLREVTATMITGRGQYARDLTTLRRLALHPRHRLEPDGAHPSHQRVAALLEMCQHQGTLPFAGLARAAFTAVTLANSLADTGVLTRSEVDGLLGSANQSTTRLQNDFAALDKADFLERYGHVRPGMYDILSPRYDEQPGLYFNWSRRGDTTPPTVFRTTSRQARDIQQLLKTYHLSITPENLLAFIRQSIGAREEAKFHFSRVLSALLTAIRKVGEDMGFDAEDMSYVPVDVVTGLTGRRPTDQRTLARAAERGRRAHALTETVCAPPLLTDVRDLVSFSLPDNEPNFVTTSRVVAPVSDADPGRPLRGTIVMIESADPGFDWVFTHDVVGLVTAFGGINSHMAIRALELGIPAVIGVGPARFRDLNAAGALEIDAAARIVRPAIPGEHLPVGALPRPQTAGRATPPGGRAQ